MNVNVNFFSAKKVRLHGMKTSKWTTRDKIAQYKGLIGLYTRDRKIIDSDTLIAKKKLERELNDLTKKVKDDRIELDNAIRGDKQCLRNTLSEHRELQLAFQYAKPAVVIEEIDQLNFNRRKTLDKLKYEKKLKSQTLIDLKLEQALLEDRLKYASLGQIKEEKQAQIITGKVQDAILRREAAESIYHIYKEILDIMKKDALYFDVILTTVTNDGYQQSRCFLGATKLGQLATEYLDDRRQEFDTLEAIILKDMAARKIDIKVLTQQVENAASSIKHLLRKDSDITTCVVQIPDSCSLHELNKDISKVEKTLIFLKNTTLVNSYSVIYPCLEEQVKQNRRLIRLAKKLERDRENMLNKTNHAQLMTNILKNTANDDVAEYIYQKQELKQSINVIKKNKEKLEKVFRYKCSVAAKIRIGLRQLLQLSYNLKPEPEKTTALVSHPFSIAQERPKKMEIPDEDETDGTKILSIITKKYSPLLSAYFELYKEKTPDEAFKQFSAVMQHRMILAHEAELQITESSLLEDLYTETSQQLTREDIKKQSEEIMAANTKNDDLLPILTLAEKLRKEKRNV